jgi:hypothetical protein
MNIFIKQNKRLKFHRTVKSHLVLNFVLGLIFGLTVLLDNDLTSALYTSLILGILLNIFEYRIYRKIEKFSLIIVQFGSMFTIFGYGALKGLMFI